MQKNLEYELPKIIIINALEPAIGICNNNGSGASGGNEGCVEGNSTSGCLGGSDVSGMCADGGTNLDSHCFDGSNAGSYICASGTSAGSSYGRCLATGVGPS